MHPERLVVKRVVAVEGDLVFPRGPLPAPPFLLPSSSRRNGHDGRAHPVGTAQDKGPARHEAEAVVVPQGHLWVEGEHPDGDRRSYDSNTYGPVSQSLVVGKVMSVVWPWRKRGWIRWGDWRGSDRVVAGGGWGKVEKVEMFAG